MKKLIYLVSIALTLSTNPSQTPLPTTSRPSIPAAFTVLDSQTLPEKADPLLQEKNDCFFYIFIAAPASTKIAPAHRVERTKMFMGITKNQHGPLIPQGFIKSGTAGAPDIPALSTAPTYCLSFKWNDKGGKNTLIEPATTFTKALLQLHRNFKKSYNCFYILVTEGRSGLLLNYATNHLLKKEAITLSAVIEIGAPLPADTEKANKDFYPNFSNSKIGTFYSFYTQHAYLSNPSHFPPSPRTDYPQAFIDQHKNLYNIRLLLDRNQRPLQNMFEGQSMKKSLLYFGQHLFECCHFIKESHEIHRDLWLNVNTSTGKKQVGSISHPADEKNTKAVRKEHQLDGIMFDNFQKQVGSVKDATSRFEMKTGQRLRSSHRPAIAHLRKSEKLTCQAA